MATDLQVLRQQLADHPLYAHVRSVDHLRVFMQYHVFAVWDFMSLAKRLQRDLTSVQVPWVPRESGLYSRLINEIILDEESDADGQGGYASHFGLYLKAMTEVGADIGPIMTYVESVRTGENPIEALDRPEIPAAVRAFVTQTLTLAQQAPLHEVAAAFFYGREDLIPQMFSALMRDWQLQGRPVDRFVYYLERHIEVDGDRHGPMVQRLLEDLCSHHDQWAGDVDRIARSVMEQRLSLWNAIDDQLNMLSVQT
ncbi:MAG: antimetabolite toxin biosynthesis protein MgoB [Sulfobacillus acidophilus]|uniref:Antimetabolite toxin biosynthesis protein MgoB n=1 Tax=Sulfobacillus acidophilus TaxID=53633 RepID=A0A2T2WEI3_9FIRM|nr:MAG: antimetabolite toxin biosynthesis protein MgoB [Sulfobacillus acidophilus]